MRFLLLATIAQHTHGLTLQRRRLGQLSAAAAVAAIRPAAQAARITSEGFAFDAPDGFEAKPKPVKTHAAEVLYKNGKREIGVVVDRVRIPAGLAPGRWVLQWRWDCEESDQVWMSCADVEIASG